MTKRIAKALAVPLVVACLVPFVGGAGGDGCDDGVKKTSDTTQQEQQEKILAEGTSAVGMPSVKNFRERRILKDIYELRDQTGIATYTYLVAENTGRLVFLGESVGYAIPAATQFSNPQKIAASYTGGQAAAYATLPQADPNGLFSPASAEGSWVLMRDPAKGDVRPVYIEPRIVVSPFKLATN